MTLEHPCCQQAWARARSATHPTVILDYDGTLVPLAPRPELAAPDPELPALLGDLAARAQVHVVSGRPRVDLVRWLGDLPIGLHAEHGFWSRVAPGEPWRTLPVEGATRMDEVRAMLERACGAAPGSFIEEKAVSLAWHYRACERRCARDGLRGIEEAAARLLEGSGLELLHGAEVVEVRPRAVHKGMAARVVLDSAPPDALVLAIGDDVTDEDLFAALPEDAFTIHVGEGPSRASCRLAGPREVRALLSEVGRAGGGAWAPR